MHWIGRKRLSQLHRDKILNLGQVGYLTLLLEHVNVASGYIEVTAAFMAEEQKLQRTRSSRYLNELIGLGLLVRDKHKKLKSVRYLPHPYLFSACGPEERGRLWAKFSELREESLDELKAEAQSWIDRPSHDEIVEDYEAAEEAKVATERRQKLEHRQRLAEAAKDFRRRRQPITTR
jgi:predicted transcriptional regulator